jgi:hypothetical protein
VGIESSYRLHVEENSVLYVSSAGQFLRLKPTDLDARLGKAGTYRILALPCNYGLIVKTYQAIIRLRERYNFGELLIGSPLACKPENSGYQNLYSVSHAQVHDLLPNRWHLADRYSYHNYLLCHIFNSDDKDPGKINAVYSQHPLKPYFDFIGMNDPMVCASFIAQIVDPRWYINADRPYRLNKFYHLFDVTPESAHKNWQRKYKGKNSKNIYNVISEVPNLNRYEALLQDLETGLDGPNMVLKASRRFLNFMVRNWLNVLTGLPYFDPKVFFKRAETINAYCRIAIKD